MMNSPKEVLLGEEARARLKQGVDIVGDAVGTTIGPRGKNVVIERKYGSPTITNDGYTVANNIDDLSDPFVNAGVLLAYQAAKKTNSTAGDGTSTATILTQHIYAEAHKIIASGVNAMVLRKGMEKAAAAAVEAIVASSRQVGGLEELEWVAGISANDTELGKLIAGVLHKVGKDGGVNIEDGRTSDVDIEYVSGVTFDRGFVSPYFAGAEQETQTTLDNPSVFVTDQKISSASDIVPFLEKFLATGQKSLLIIAEDIEGEALGTLVLNKLRGVLDVVAVKAPAFGDRRRGMLEDYAIFSGGELYAKETGVGWADVGLDYLGSVESATIRKDETVLIKGAGSKKDVKKRIDFLWGQHEAAKNDFDREKLSERANTLSGTVAVINVGAPTEVEQKERKARVEDAVHASRAALEDGVVPGGGTALIRAASKINDLDLSGDERIGAGIIQKALSQPLMRIADNAGEEGAVVASKVSNGDGAFGFNAATGEYEDLVEAGIVDPTKVVRLAIENAVSAAVMITTTETLVVDAPETR